MYASWINVGLFILALLFVKFGSKFIYRFHGKWYDLSDEQIKVIMYGSLLFYKIIIIFFNIVPCLVLYFFM